MTYSGGNDGTVLEDIGIPDSIDPYSRADAGAARSRAQLRR
jgi:hypothetical protein